MRRWLVGLPDEALPGVITTTRSAVNSVFGYGHGWELEHRKEMAAEISFIGFDRFQPPGTLATGL